MQISKWGNSLAVRLPASVVEALKLQEGDNIEITIADLRRFEIARTPTTADRLKTLRRHRGALPKDFKFGREAAHER